MRGWGLSFYKHRTLHRRDEKLDFLKSGQISIGPNKAYAGGYSGTVILLNNRDAMTLDGKTYEQIVAAATPRPSSKTMTFTFPISNMEESGSITTAYSGPLSPTGLTITDFYMTTNLSDTSAITSPVTTAIPIKVETLVQSYHPSASNWSYETKLLWTTNNNNTTITLAFYCYSYYRGVIQRPSDLKLSQFTLTGTIT